MGRGFPPILGSLRDADFADFRIVYGTRISAILGSLRDADFGDLTYRLWDAGYRGFSFTETNGASSNGKKSGNPRPVSKSA